MIRCKAALAIRRAGKRHLGRLARDEVRDLDGVPDGVNVRVVGLQLLVDANPTARPDLQARRNGEPVLRPHPDAQNDELRGERLPDFRRTVQPVGRQLEGLGGLAQQERDALGSPGARRAATSSPGRAAADLVLQLDHRGRDAAADEVLGQFQADKPGPHHDRPLDALVHQLLDAVHVLEVSQREDAGQVDAGNRRPQRSGARCQDQLVVRLPRNPPEARSRTRTVFALRSMASTEVRVRTSRPEAGRSRSGVATSSLSRSAISPPT